MSETKWELWPVIDMAPRETEIGVQFKALAGRFTWRGDRYRVPQMMTDFASVPRIVRPLIGQIGRHAAAAVAHDAGYRGLLEVERIVDPAWNAALREIQIGNPGGAADAARQAHDDAGKRRQVLEVRPANLSRSDCDRMFLELMAISGSKRWRRRAAWAAVRLFGGRAYGGPFRCVQVHSAYDDPHGRCIRPAGHQGEHVTKGGKGWHCEHDVLAEIIGRALRRGAQRRRG